MNSEFDWSKVKVRQVGGKPPKPRQGKFVTVSLNLMEKLWEAKHASTFKIVLYLLDTEWRSPGQPVRLSNLNLKLKGISRDQKARALRELTKLDLIHVEGGKLRQSPLVRLNREAAGD